ncbi:MAG: hypothetical protein QM674_17700 [Burkholderiaceae bacterium]
MTRIATAGCARVARISASVGEPLVAGLVVWLAFCGAPGSAYAAPSDASLLESGRALFHGERAFQRSPSVAGAPLPADAAACANCHGGGESGARGGREAGVSVPWLTPGLRASPAHAARVLGALERGESVQGRPLQPPMPRYAFTQAERDALTEFLGVLGTDDEPVRGVSRTRLHFGVVLPAGGGQAQAARAAWDGLREQIDVVNRAGGLYGRELSVVAIAIDADPAVAPGAWQSQLSDALARQPVLALVGSWIGDLPDEQWRWLRAQRLPLIANLGPALREPAGPPGWVSSLLPSVQAQLGGTLAEFERECGSVASAEATHRPLHVTHAALPGLRDAISAALPGRELRFDARAQRASSSGSGSGRWLALLSSAELASLRQGLNPDDCLWSLAMFSGASAGSTDVVELIALPAQSALPLAGGDPRSLWLSLGRLAGQMVTELLSRAGRSLQPEALVRAQSTLPPFEPVAGVRLELSRQRRHALPVVAFWRKP